MSLNRIIKLQSNEGGPVSSSNPQMSFTIPAGSTYDLSKSFLHLNCNITDDAGDNFVYMPQVSLNNDQGAADTSRATNIAIIKNANMRCAQGTISDIRRVDLLRNTLNYYNLTTDELTSTSYSGLCSAYDEHQQIGSIFRDINRLGNVISRNVDSVIKIPLKQIFNFGNVSEYDTSKFGATHLDLELQLSKINIAQYLGATAGTNWSRQDRNKITSFTAAATDNLAILETERTYADIASLPFWVGQKLAVTFTKTGDAAATVNRNIIQISESTTDDGKYDIFLDSAIVAITGAQTVTVITVAGVDVNFEFNCNSGHLILEEVTGASDTPSEIQYTEYVSQYNTTAAVRNFQKQFQIEPECINLLIMNGGSHLSRKNNVTNWRLRLNNEDLTNRGVTYHSPLSLDRLGMTFNNSNMPLNNLNELFQTVPTDGSVFPTIQVSYAATNQTLIICNPLPITEGSKMVQLNVNSSGVDITEIVLYKEVLKTISA
jgi:hypothetical protein